MARHQMPDEFVPGDQITFDGEVATRGRRSWSWASDGWLTHLLYPLSDRDMRELLRDEHPKAYVSALGARPTDQARGSQRGSDHLAAKDSHDGFMEARAVPAPPRPSPTDDDQTEGSQP